MLDKEKTEKRVVSDPAERGAKPVGSSASANTVKANNQKLSPKLIAICVIASLISGLLGAGLIFALQRDGLIGKGVGGIIVSSEDGNKDVPESQRTIAAVADKVSPSVVSISTAQSGQRSNRVFQGAGTGIIVSSNGYIVTNKHVVDGARNISVATTAGDIYDNVKLVGSDPLNDVAFLKVSGVDDMKPATIGDSLTLSIGQPVVAIGNSLGEYQNTVTSGIVSGLGRPIIAQSGDGTSYESLSDLIQTDAAINPGNSGGPLVNLSGQVVGINTAVATEAQGIGFAIPISAVKGMLKGVVETGEVNRPYIGVRYLDITPVVAKSNDLPVKNGAYVSSELVSGNAIEPDGPADKAGIKDGDIIVAVNGTDIGPNASLSSLISQYQPGDEVELKIMRDGDERTVDVTLATYEVPEEVEQESTRTDEVERPRDLRWLFGF